MAETGGMGAGDPLRDLLVADLALVLKPAAALDVAAAVLTYWEEQGRAEAGLARELARIDGLSPSQLHRIEREVDDLVAAAGGSREALRERGGIDETLHASIALKGGEIVALPDFTHE